MAKVTKCSRCKRRLTRDDPYRRHGAILLCEDCEADDDLSYTLEGAVADVMFPVVRERLAKELAALRATERKAH